MKNEKIKQLKEKLGYIFLKREKEKFLNPKKFIKLNKNTSLYLGLLNFVKTFSFSMSLNVMFFSFIGGFVVSDFKSDAIELLTNSFIFSTIITFILMKFRESKNKNKNEDLIKEKIEKGDLQFLKERFFSNREVDEFSMDYSRIYDSLEFKKMLSSLRVHKEDLDFISKKLKETFTETELRSALNSKDIIEDVKENNGVSYKYLYLLLERLETQNINENVIDFQYKTLLSLNEKNDSNSFKAPDEKSSKEIRENIVESVF